MIVLPLPREGENEAKLKEEMKELSLTGLQ
jgi:hypothetical protein